MKTGCRSRLRHRKEADQLSRHPLLAGGQGRPTRDIRDSSIIILMCLCGAAGAILGGIIGYLIR